MTPGAILRDALAALGLLRMRSVVDALLKRRDDVGKVFLDHLVDAEERARRTSEAGRALAAT
jgi:hypothetical protein